MADVVDVFSEIRRSCRGIPNPTLRDAIVRSARMFCFNSWYVRREVDLVLNPTLANPAVYQVPTVANEEPLNILRGSLNDNGYFWPLTSKASRMFNPNWATWNIQRPRGYAFTPNSTITFYPNPDQAYPVKLMVPVQPVKGGSTIPDELVQNYEQAIGAGALMWLFRQRTAEWYDPDEAARSERDFWRDCNKAKVQATRDFQTGDMRVERVPFPSQRWR